MRRLNILFTLAIVAVYSFSFAQNQNDPVLLTVDGVDVKLTEFEAVYKKNNKSVDQKSLEEYLDLYIKFKLKVHNAEELGMDTLPRFIKELAGYRKQLAEPYLSDNEVTEELIKEAYERLQFEIRASHIMVKLEQNASPADTLKAYKKMQDIRAKVMNGGDFTSIAREYSDDPSVKDNGGDLGYFSALFMVYSFESAAYKTEIGKVSNILRTQFGYHIIKVADKRKNNGEITVAHIMTRIPKEANEADIEASRMKINEIYAKLEAGENWDELARQYSEDKTTSSRGGKLPPFTSGRMVMEFEDASFALKNDGDFSKPVRTEFGFHIVKRLNLKGIGTFDEMIPELKQKISRDGRSKLGKVSFISKVKKEYNFTETAARKADFYKLIDTSFFQLRWTADRASNLKRQLFKLGDTVITQTDFAKYIEKHQTKREEAANMVVDRLYEAYVEEVCITYEDKRLLSKYPEFRMLMNEYHDGILLFDLTDERVWTKAVKDTAGLEAFYELHKNEHMWGDRLEGSIYSCANKDVAKEVLKMVKSREKKGYTDASILEAINTSSQLNLEITNGKFSKGDQPIIDKVEWSKGLKTNIELDGRIFIVDVKNLLTAEPKLLSEVKGLMTSAYQNHLEEEWVKELQTKYPVTVHPEHLSLIK